MPDRAGDAHTRACDAMMPSAPMAPWPRYSHDDAMMLPPAAAGYTLHSFTLIAREHYAFAARYAASTRAYAECIGFTSPSRERLQFRSAVLHKLHDRKRDMSRFIRCHYAHAREHTYELRRAYTLIQIC